MSYLVVKQSGSNKSFELKTSVPAKPYMAVKTAVAGTAYLALGTDTTGAGMLVKGNGTNYKVVESYTTTRATTTNTIKNTTTSVNTQSTNTYTYTQSNSGQISSLSGLNPLNYWYSGSRGADGIDNGYIDYSFTVGNVLNMQINQMGLTYAFNESYISNYFTVKSTTSSTAFLNADREFPYRLYTNTLHVPVKAGSNSISFGGGVTNYGNYTVSTQASRSQTWNATAIARNTMSDRLNANTFSSVLVLKDKYYSGTVITYGTTTTKKSDRTSTSYYTVSQNTTVSTTSNTTETITVQ